MNHQSVRWTGVAVAAMVTAVLLSACGDNPRKTDLSKAEVKVEKPSATVLPDAAPSTVAAIADTPNAGQAVKAIAAEGKYLFLALHRGPDGSDSPLLSSAAALAQATSGKAVSMVGDVRNPELADLLKAIKVDPEVCPAPLLLIVSPNKLITGTFTKVPEAQALQATLLPPQVLEVREQLATGKFVWVITQSKNTAGNAETEQNLTAFLADPANKDAKKMVVRKIDLDLPENADFLKAVKIDPKGVQCATLVLAPPMKVLSKPIVGVATVEALKLAAKPCTSCAPGG